MFRRALKTRIDPDGHLEVVDPDWESLPLLEAIDPNFRIRCGTLDGFVTPRFQKARRQFGALRSQAHARIPLQELWTAHDAAVATKNYAGKQKDGDCGVSLLDLKVEIAGRLLEHCRLCGRECGVNRNVGESGRCGMGAAATVGELFVHIAEEPMINPSLNVNLQGCGLGCVFCQKPELLCPEGEGKPLATELWAEIVTNAKPARSISFIGGNPDESLFAVLNFLNTASREFNIPLVWNCHGYASKDVYRLLDGVVDVYVPDAKFFRKECSTRLAGCANYFEVFAHGLEEMVAQGVPVIVRLLVIPGHEECCHHPMINFLGSFKGLLKLNIMDQYSPQWGATMVGPNELATRPGRLLVQQLRDHALEYGQEWVLI